MNAKSTSKDEAISLHYRIDDLLIDAAQRRVTRDGAALAVVGLSFDVLLVLAREAPNLVPIDRLIEQAWAGAVVSPETVIQRVKMLRQCLGDDAEHNRYIGTVRGRGYRIVARVQVVSSAEEKPAEAQRDRTPPASRVPTGFNTSRARLAGIVVTMLLMTLGALQLAHKEQHAEQSPANVSTRDPIPTTGRVSLAVMPFANLTGDASKDYLGDGMAEELINMLSKVPGLRVPARTSTFAYKSRSADIKQIAKNLNVETILEGSVRTAGKTIRITVQLIDARTDSHLWSETYERQFADIFALQDELSTAIVSALRANLKDASPLYFTAQTPPTQDVEAYNLYLQGWSLTERPTAENLNRAIEYCGMAAQRDPRFARAHGCVAEAHMDFNLLGQTSMHLAAAKQAGERAVALDSSESRALLSLAGESWYRGQWLQMAERDRAAMAASDGDGFVRMIASVHLQFTGHLREGLQEARQAYAAAPANPFVVAGLARALWLSGVDADAAKYADLAVLLGFNRNSEPLRSIHTMKLLRQQQYAEAANFITATFDSNSRGWARAADLIKSIYPALGNRDKYQAAFAAHEKNWYVTGNGQKIEHSLATSEACMASSYAYAMLGALDESYSAANECLDNLPAPEVVPGLTTMSMWSPEMKSFRRDSRFAAFVARLGLMNYYRQYGPPDDCELKTDKLICS